MNDKRYSELEDDLQNFWTFVKLESRKLLLLIRKVEQMEKTLTKILEDNSQRSVSIEEKDE